MRRLNPLTLVTIHVIDLQDDLTTAKMRDAVDLEHKIRTDREFLSGMLDKLRLIAKNAIDLSEKVKLSSSHTDWILLEVFKGTEDEVLSKVIPQVIAEAVYTHFLPLLGLVEVSTVACCKQTC